VLLVVLTLDHSLVAEVAVLAVVEHVVGVALVLLVAAVVEYFRDQAATVVALVIITVQLL
jgi:hypothetical protein|tara:strand:- start:119 stop:298 length:180 start_codon:yes stop_codon:yes gene_type:complete